MGGGGGLEQFSVSPRPLDFGLGTKGFEAKGLGPGLDLVFKVTVLFPEIIDVRGVATILPPHEGDILAGLFKDLGSAALVTLTMESITIII